MTTDRGERLYEKYRDYLILCFIGLVTVFVAINRTTKTQDTPTLMFIMLVFVVPVGIWFIRWSRKVKELDDKNE